MSQEFTEAFEFPPIGSLLEDRAATHTWVKAGTKMSPFGTRNYKRCLRCGMTINDADIRDNQKYIIFSCNDYLVKRVMEL